MIKNTTRAVLLATAFAGTAAHAQTSGITLYGRINTSVEYQDNDVIDKTVMRNNSSRWGMRGTEDLGNGLSAFFLLEAGYNSDDGSGAGGFGRYAYVGLRSTSLGQLKLGRMASPVYLNTIDYIGFFNHDTGTTSEDNIYRLAGFLSNAVEYTTPKFGPVSAAVAVSASEGAGPKSYEAVVNVDQDALHASVGYSQTKNVLDQKTRDGISAAAAYTFGPVRLGLAYEHDKETLAGGNRGKRDALTFTGQYSLGNNEFHVSIGHADEWSRVANSDATQYTLGYNYKLSKRTKVYGFYYVADNNATTELNNTGPNGVPALANRKLQVLGVGVRHNF